MARVVGRVVSLDPDYLDDWCSSFGRCRYAYDGDTLEVTFMDELDAAAAAKAMIANGVTKVRVFNVPNDPDVQALAAMHEEVAEDVELCSFGEGFPDPGRSPVPPPVIGLASNGDLVIPKPRPQFGENVLPFLEDNYGASLQGLAVITLRMECEEDQVANGMVVALSPNSFVMSKHLFGMFVKKLRQFHGCADEVIFCVFEIASASLRMCHEPHDTHDVSATIRAYIRELDPKSVLPASNGNNCAMKDDFAILTHNSPIFQKHFVPRAFSDCGPFAIIAVNGKPTTNYIVQKILPFAADTPIWARQCYENGQLSGKTTVRRLNALNELAEPWRQRIIEHFNLGFDCAYLCVANEAPTPTRTAQEFAVTLACTHGASGAPCITPGHALALVGINSTFKGQTYFVRVDTAAFAGEYAATLLKGNERVSRRQKEYFTFMAEKYPSLKQVRELLAATSVNLKQSRRKRRRIRDTNSGFEAK
eukprot:TRINITY_DN7592_c0_g2_i10.p1 TRINITY_DN7592_c0_g2~~TRINITY_DN7592_c0_g2_i10.p1  ORF type:complete len:484 (+),score=57.58 TRINITY_DN7592_c0_g2_i10:24-1454(+)